MVLDKKEADKMTLSLKISGTTGGAVSQTRDRLIKNV